MKAPIYSILAIIVAAILLLTINEFTEIHIIRDFSYFFIMAAMLVGVLLDSRSDKR